MKKLFNFTIPKKETVEVEETSTNEKGEQITIKKKEEKEIQHKFFIRKPSRSMMDNGKLYYGVKFADAVRAGLLPMSLLAKRFTNDKGVLSELEKEKYANLYTSLIEKRSELEKISTKPAEERTQEEKDNNQKLMSEITSIYRQLQELEINQTELFSNTAEAYARDRVTVWWASQLAYKEDDKLEPLYGKEGDADDKRIEKLDAIFDGEDDFAKKIANSFLFLIGFWFTGRINDEADFESAWRILKEEILK